MKVFVLIVNEQIEGVYSCLHLALDAGTEYEEEEENDVAISQWDVEEEKVEPQRMMVIYEDWGPKIRMGNN